MQESNCIFCKIVSGEIPGDKVFEDDRVTAFRDIRPSAPVHVLVVPNRHIASLGDLQVEDEVLMGHLFTAARQIAEQEGIARSGYRLILNNGPDAGQEVHHIHLHVLGGQRMRHPMG